ncbi:MAG: hypothetical protein ACRDWH_05230 [Acidimicrobiia bacterium]
MATVARAVRLGMGWGALGGAIVGTGTAIVLLLGSGEVGNLERAAGLLLYGAMGGIAGTAAGAAIGLVMGVLVGVVVNLLLGPAELVPRRCGQRRLVRITAASMGLFPLAGVAMAGVWWPLPVAVGILSVTAIAAKAPQIAGISGCLG